MFSLLQAPSVDMLSPWRISLPEGWVDQTTDCDQCVRLCKLKNLPLESKQPVVVELCLVVNTDGSWSVYARHCCLGSSSCKLLENVPDIVTPECLPAVVKLLDSCSICTGHTDKEYCELAKSRKGVFKDSSGKTVKASLDTTPFVSSRRYYKEAVRTTRCDILVSSGRCAQCKAYRTNLRSLAKKAKTLTSPNRRASTSASTWNWRYLTTPQRRQRVKSRTAEVCCCNTFNTWAINRVRAGAGILYASVYLFHIRCR